MQGGGVQEGKGRDSDVHHGGVQEGEGQHDDVHDNGVQECEGQDGEVHGGLDTNKGNAYVINEGGIVGYVSFDDSEDASFKYDSALEIAFDDSDDSDDFVDKELNNLIDYDNAHEGTINKNKHKWEEHKEKVNGSEKLENVCESDENNETAKKKYPIFKLHKDTANYKWELGTYSSVRCDFKMTQ